MDDIIITRKKLEILNEYSGDKFVFVFGDNLLRKGYGGAAKLRDVKNTYSFITKKYPNNKDESFYTVEEYRDVFENEYNKLVKLIEENPRKIFLISRLGAGLANRFKIYEEIIERRLIELEKNYPNAILLFDEFWTVDKERG